MPLPHDKRKSCTTTPNKFFMLMHVHAHLIGVGLLGTKQRKLTASTHLALVTSVSKKVAKEVICLYNIGETLVPKVVSWPIRTIELEVVCHIRELVLKGNKNGVLIHSKLLIAELANRGTIVNVRTLQRYLKVLGFCYGKGNRHKILHDMKANIDFQNVYL